MFQTKRLPLRRRWVLRRSTRRWLSPNQGYGGSTLYYWGEPFPKKGLARHEAQLRSRNNPFRWVREGGVVWVPVPVVAAEASSQVVLGAAGVGWWLVEVPGMKVVLVSRVGSDIRTSHSSLCDLLQRAFHPSSPWINASEVCERSVTRASRLDLVVSSAIRSAYKSQQRWQQPSHPALHPAAAPSVPLVQTKRTGDQKDSLVRTLRPETWLSQ